MSLPGLQSYKVTDSLEYTLSCFAFVYAPPPTTHTNEHAHNMEALFPQKKKRKRNPVADMNLQFALSLNNI